MTPNDLVEFPKIDLHLHLDGAIRTRTIWELAQEQNIELPADSPEELEDHVHVTPECRSLSDFLQCFEVLYPVIQEPSAMERIAYELCEDLARQNVIYAETRFAPVLMTEKGASQREVVDAVLKGLRAGEKEYDLPVRLLLCLYRGTQLEDSFETVEIASDYRERGVVGIDLAGDESQFSARDHAGAFEEARSNDLKVTIHAGEAGPAENIREALELGAHRIGHGVRLVDDEPLLQRVIDQNIPLEICLTSNVQTQAVPSYDDHPARSMYQQGVPITLNTDDPAISNIDLTHEYRLALETFGFTFQELKDILYVSAESAFADSSDKESLRSTIENLT